MEESGHYYSVYYVSLAVGFLNRIARQHAFFAQMPDEVDMLDAFDLEVSYGLGCASGYTPSNMAAVMMGAPTYSSQLIQQDLQHFQGCRTANDWRLRVEHGLHALTGRNAQAEQNRTRDLLLATRDTDFVRLGFLLHRFGDTYAHTRLDDRNRRPEDQSLYRADPEFRQHGHAGDGHEPDEPWGQNRRALMRRYLMDLYALFDTMAQRSNPANLRPTLRSDKISVGQVIEDFGMAERAVDELLRQRMENCMDSIYDGRRGVPMAYLHRDAGLQNVYILALRRRIADRTNGLLLFDSYDPENRELLTWNSFLNQYRAAYPILNQYTEESLRDVIRQINIDTNTIPTPTS